MPGSAADLFGGLEGRRVVVTAGANGIGLAIARTLVGFGARVVICDISEAGLASASATKQFAAAVNADVASEADVDRLFQTAEDVLGGLDALVNNAGIAGPTAKIQDIALEDWRRCLDVGLTGQFLCARRAVPMLLAAGGGSIVSMSSAAGRHGYALRSAYSAAKFGVIGLTLSLAKELGPENIRVNAILPGIVEGPRIERVIADRAEALGLSTDAMRGRYLQNVSLRRMTSPNDIAGMVAFLLSDAGSNISGQSLGVDGNIEAL